MFNFTTICVLSLLVASKSQQIGSFLSTWQSTDATSLISLILDPPLPMSEPHWLAGTTSRNVTGGLLVTVLFVMDALISCQDKLGHKHQDIHS